MCDADEQLHDVQRHRRHLHVHISGGEEGRLSHMFQRASTRSNERDSQVSRIRRPSRGTIVSASNEPRISSSNTCSLQPANGAVDLCGNQRGLENPLHDQYRTDARSNESLPADDIARFER